jgi:hypothetical protein
MTKIEKQLEQARADRDAINHELNALDASKAEASRTSAAFGDWRSSVVKKTGERERLDICISTLEAEVEQAKRDAARADLLSRRAALEKQTSGLARRIAEEGAGAGAMLVQLAKDAAANAIDVERLNRELTEDEQLVPADNLARHRNPVPREDLEATFVDLWTYESNGGLISDQDAVVERSRDRGFIPSTKVKRTPTHVVRKRFKQVRYLAPGDREYFEPLISVMRLPRFDGPGMMFDRGLAVEEIIPARQELVELIPAPDVPAKPATPARSNTTSQSRAAAMRRTS